MSTRTKIVQIKHGLYYAHIQNEHGRNLESHAWGTRENAEAWLRERMKDYSEADWAQRKHDIASS